ncbi:hypothetical protein [Muribaculum caecicola]|jgi:hypothetical protein|uniref:Uncharacterized protein n=1 Tax=Muribaculum caecicola TaxID=3038144 RepID=A0AC61S917_9BACT|nr:hypothetical protein [Muribaculum caecicola]THG55136.1 hypothetical protein E5990_00820 [Muribaculum caecicola]
MIFNFRLVSDEVENFRREISIDADSTFLDLRNAICDSVGYDKNQMCSFFLCDDNWEKNREITLEDMGSDSDQDIFLMEETILSDYIDDGQKLIFVFDYLTDRCFFLEMKKSQAGKNLKDPICIASMGIAPAQIMDFNEFEAKTATAATSAVDLDEDFYGSDQYNADEFDTEGFDEMTFDE